MIILSVAVLVIAALILVGSAILLGVALAHPSETRFPVALGVLIACGFALSALLLYASHTFWYAA